MKEDGPYRSSRRAFLEQTGRIATFAAVTSSFASRTWAAAVASVAGDKPGVHTGRAWPQRPLMQAPFENSLMYRNLSKPVHESAFIDDMETDRSWSAWGKAGISYTSERAKDGQRSLRFHTSLRDEEQIREHRTPDGAGIIMGGLAGALLKFDKPQDWSRFNRISLWVFVHPTSMQSHHFLLRFYCDGQPLTATTPNMFHLVDDLKPGEWNHVVWEMSEYKRDQVTAFEIYEWLTGHDPEDEGTVIFDFDRIEVQRVDVEQFEGWEVAPGKIAFQHVGYLPSGEKLAFASGATGNQFELVDAASNSSVGTFPVKDVRTRRGRFQVLDFTSFTRPGQYLLRCGKLATRPFPIADDFWYSIIEKSLNYYYGARCGFDVPGRHHVCHQDMRGIHDGQIKPTNGGWHDASDFNQYSRRTCSGVYALLQTYDQLRQRKLWPDLRERVLEEACWGLDWLLKTRFGNGYRITGQTIRIYTDNTLGTDDDIVVPARNIANENLLFSAVAGYAARILKDAEPQRAAQSLQAAEEDYPTGLQGREEWNAATRDEAAFGTLAAIELFRTTGKQSYAGDAVRLGRLVTQCQQQRFLDGSPVTGWFYETAQRQHALHENHDSTEWSPLMALRALCETFPVHEDWMEWYGAAVLHSEYFYRQGAVISEPYRHIPNSVWRRDELEEMVEVSSQRRSILPHKTLSMEEALEKFNAGVKLSGNQRLLVFPIPSNTQFHGNSNVQLSGAVALVQAARLRNEAALDDLARRQLQWVFGGNPFSQTLMYGAGYDYTQLWTMGNGNVVGSLAVGMDCMKDDSPWWTSTVRATYREMWGEPNHRLLSSLSHVAVPALVTGSAPQGATFREQRTGQGTEVPSGDFSRNLPPGDYTVEYGKATRRISILGGGRYKLSLDPQHTVDMSLSFRDSGSDAMVVTAQLRGAGAHTLELRGFNCSTDTPHSEVRFSEGREESVSWTVKAGDKDRPWVVVVIADGDMDNVRELCEPPGWQ